MVEIDEDRLRALQTYENLLSRIGNGKQRQQLLKLIKAEFPETVIPEIDAAAPYEQRLKKIEEELATREQKEVERRAERTIAEARKKLREEGWDDEGIEKIEAYMRERGNPDYDSAAAYIRSTLPKETALPSTFAGQRFGWFDPPKDDVDHTLLMKNPRAYQDQQIQKWLAEKRGRRSNWGGQ